MPGSSVLAKKDWAIPRRPTNAIICRHSDCERLSKQIANDLETVEKTIKFHRKCSDKKLGAATWGIGYRISL